MPLVKYLGKTTYYPRPHSMFIDYCHGLESGVTNHSTIVPIAMTDYGLGSASAYKSNPFNMSFAEAEEPNCYPDSKINYVTAELAFTLTKDAIETDKLHAVRAAFMPIFTSFDDITVADKNTSETIGSILELDREDTHYQSYPLWNGVKMKTGFTGTGDELATNVPGLTTDQTIEGVTFNQETFYDALHYYTIGDKLKNVCGGLKWFILTKNKPVKRFRIKLRSKTKRMNDYTFAGVLTHVPQVGYMQQIAAAAHTTDLSHIHTSLRVRYNEWHEKFDTERV